MITLTDAFTRFDAGVTADTRTYSTTEYTLPAKCPKQTPDGFSVPGWGGLAALPGGGGGGQEWEWKSDTEGPYTWPRGLPCFRSHFSG